jgi:hypothetical protein
VVATATEESKMLKRTIIALSFIVALCAAGFGISSAAEARHGCGYYGYDSYYPSYYDYYDYGPRVSYYRHFDDDDHWHHRHHRRHHHRHHDHHDSGLYFSIGF